MRFAVNVLSGALLVLTGAASAQAQLGYDRPGSDYPDFTVQSGDPAACAARCERDGHCRAWSFAYPHTKNLPASCSLKNKVTPRVKDDCCVSGVRGAGVIEPRRGHIEYSIDRHGGDYRSFDTATDPAGSALQGRPARPSTAAAPGAMCGPAMSSGSARCYLKSKIPRPRRKPCCISGVVR